MNYELSVLEELAADKGISVRPEDEIARIRQAFLAMALSHKKEIFLRRYFRVHHEGLQLLVNRLKGSSASKAKGTKRGAAAGTKKRLLALSEDLLTYLSQGFGRYLEPPPGEGLDPDDPDIDSQKVITTFSLPELGVIIRLFIEAGVFRVRNRKALTRFMSRNVAIRTKQIPENFSEEHLYNAIHSPSEPAMDRLQTVLNQMLVELNKLRREQRKKG